MTEPRSKISAERAKQICKRFDVSDTGAALLTPELTPLPFLEALLEARAFVDAVNFLAFGLPKREAVWWASVSLRAAGAAPSGPAHEAVSAAEEWVRRPSEENRIAAGERAERLPQDQPAGWAAWGAFWSGGSMTPPNSPPVPPGATLTAKAVAGAVTLAAAKDPKRAQERFAQFIALGKDIALGGNGRLKA
ncbi:MAG TPA: hypothetical protein VM689_04220 [Aliidongia sp.]|nr:hypothetical protein [Aliidongia sp.]